jgi:iron complex outermembrane recepter protein
MRSKLRKSGPRFQTTCMVAALAAGSTGALAQNQPAAETLQEVVVTGSRIKRTGFDTLQPATVVGSDFLEDRALVNVGDALQEIPAFGLPGSSPSGGQSGVQVGQSFVNYFGLGSQRTLTLVDGKRFVAANTPSVNGGNQPGLQVDLNTIPAALIDRIETIAIGGAPVYGSDAVAGTVNIILKRKFEGFSGQALGGITDAGGAERQRIQGLYGFNFNEGRGNLTMNAEFNKQAGLLATERKSMAESLSFQAPAASDPRSARYANVLIRDSHVVLTNFDGLPLRNAGFNFPNNFANAIKDAQGRPMQFTSEGTLVPYDPGTPTGSSVWFSGGDGLFLTETQSLLTDSERKLGNIFLNYDLSDNVRLNVQGWYARTEATEVANQPSYNEWSFRVAGDRAGNAVNGPVALRLDNPFLSDQARGIIAANLPDVNADGVPDATIDFDGNGIADTMGFWLSKGHQDLFRGSKTAAEQTLYRGVVGLDGDFEVGTRKYSWDVSYAQGRTRSEAHNMGMLISEFNLAIDAVRDPVSGQIRCRDTTAVGCAPLNIFGNGVASADAAAYVTEQFQVETEIEQKVASANITGAVFTLPGGDVSFATGVEYRKESSAFRPDALSASGLLRGAPLAGISGSFDTKEIYTEAVVPIFGASQNIPALEMLELEGAIRYVDHSTAGGDTTWTAGLRYAPVRGLQFRGNKTESIRAPAVTELFLPTSQIAAFANDPCDSRFLNQGANAGRRTANCAAVGIPPNFQSTIVNASQLVTVEGNQNLANEKAKAWTVGVVFEPSFAPGLSMAVDWVDIELQDAIEQLSATVILQACYDSADFPTAAVCQRFDRDAGGQVINMRTGYLNAGTLDFSGLTAEISYDFSFEGIGDFRAGLNYFYLDTLNISVTGTDFNPQAGERNFSRNRAMANLTYSRGPVRAMLQTQYIGDAVFDRTDKFDQPAPLKDTRDLRGIDEFWLFNTSLGYQFTDALSAQLNVDNVLDEEPPFGALVGTIGGTASGASSTYFSGILGRTYALSVRVNF